MNDKEFIARRAHLASQNVMTADNPPADDVQALTEQYIEQYTDRLMEDLYETPERIQEYILETSYENTKLLLLCEKLGEILYAPPTPAVIAEFIAAADNFFAERITAEAKTYVENL